MSVKVTTALLSNGTATGSSLPWPGGHGVFVVDGTLSGATVTLQMKSPNGSWLPVDALNTSGACARTATGVSLFLLPSCEVRAAVSGGTPSGLYAYISHASV